MQNESIFAEGALDRIFAGEVIENRRKDGAIQYRVIRGFRHESLEAAAAGFTVVEGTRDVPDAQGVYHAKASAHGVERRQGRSVFFPRNMSRAEIVAAIEAAYVNCEQANPSSRWFVGRGGGMKLALELHGGKVVDVVPQQGRVSQLRRALWQYQHMGKINKRLCRECLQPKISVCPLGHNSQLRPRVILPKHLRWIRRWLSWKRSSLGG